MIPKKIHYVWFGGSEKPPETVAFIRGWRSLMPDHEVIEWNESNINVSSHPYMQRMYNEGKFAFASDYARLMILRYEGGIYLDTDVELKKSLDPFNTETCFWSFEFDHFLSTCVIGCEPNQPVISALMKEYDHLEKEIVNNTLVTKYFIKHFPEFRLNNKDQVVGGNIRIFPKEYFVVPAFGTSRNFSVHHADNHWKSERKDSPIGTAVRAVIGDVLYFKLINLKMGWNDEFRPLEKARRDL